MATPTFKTLRDLFDELYGTLPLPVFLFDGTTRVVKANTAFLELARISPSDLMSYRISDLFRFLHTARFPVPPHYFTKLRTPDGQEIPVELNHVKFSGDDERSQGCAVFLTDLRETFDLRERISRATLEIETLKLQLSGGGSDSALEERVRLEQQLKAEKAFLENVIESCGDGIFILDSRGTIIRANEAFAKIVGRDKREISGKLYELGPAQGTFIATTGQTVVLDQSYQDYTYRQMERFLRLGDGEKIENWEFYVFNRSGQIVPVDMTATMQKNSQGVITGAVCVMRDSTERKKAELAIQEAYRFRTRFFTNITHELRTPLTLIIGPLEEILRRCQGTMDASFENGIQIALRNARRLLDLINQLLDLSMLQAGAHTLIKEKRDLNAFISSLLDSFAPLAQKKNIRCSYERSRDVGEVVIDPVNLEKVLFNLIGNAFKFTPEGGSIRVVAEFEGCENSEGQPCGRKRFIRISVIDTGIGIKQEHVGKIFDRFYRADPGPHQHESGTGIGLAYVKELVEVMGGTIEVTSRYGEGSTFSIRIPVDDIPHQPQTAPENAARQEPLPRTAPRLFEAADEQESIPDSIEGRGPLVLIVDDNTDVQRYVAAILHETYDYMTATSGKIALEKIKKHPPDIILCDIMMPEMDGHALLKTVRSMPGMQKIPFVFLTARAATEMKVQGLEEGADDYLVKPFNSLELLARIKSLLRIRNLLNTTEQQQKEITLLTQKLQEKYRYGTIVGNAQSMRKIYQLIEAVKDSDANVLISGETGTGKELVANAIHYNSPRRNGPMVSVNCGAIPRELLARELFGHVKGAFTGAAESRKGYFQEADHGTLFLDEIGDMDKDMQIQLLRVLECGEIVRVGDTVPIKVDVRIIAATNKNLLEEVKKGRFREDLYYRIHVIPIHLPPLRQRREDIPLLIEHFLQKFRSKYKKEVRDLSQQDLEILLDYPYPGNVRELEHIIERYCLLGGSVRNLLANTTFVPENNPGKKMILPDLYTLSSSPLKAQGRQAKEQAEKEIILHALRTCGNNVSKAAKMLNISRVYLHKKVKKYGIAHEEYK